MQLSEVVACTVLCTLCLRHQHYLLTIYSFTSNLVALQCAALFNIRTTCMQFMLDNLDIAINTSVCTCAEIDSLNVLYALAET
eukprot:16246-Heterococcus_DN1.PRE.1